MSPAKPDVSVLVAFVEQFGVPVFPCKAGEKTPLTINGYKNASSDPAQIRKWAREHRGCNWGMPTGQLSGFAVLDVDVKDGKSGDVTLRAFEQQHGRLPDTATVITPSGGLHYWFRADPARGIPSSAGKIGVGLDVRGDGGYVVIPPSAINGNAYAFNAGSDPAEVGFASMPAALVELACAQEEPKTKQQREQHSDDLLRNVFEGEALHDSLRDLAARYVALGMPFAEVCGVLEGVLRGSQAARDERWRERFAEIPKLVQSASEKFKRDGAGAQRDLLEHSFWVREATAALDAPYVVKGLFGPEQLVVWWGAPGAGKTFVALDMACAIGAGGPWRGRRTRAGLVVYVSAESSARYVANRITALRKEWPAVDQARVLVVPVAADLLHAERGDVLAVIAACKAQGEPVAVVFIDTLSATFGGGKENLPEDMSQYVVNVRRIMTETGAAAVVLHHCGKDEARGMRGHSALLGAIDAELAVEVTPDKERILRTGKVRDGEGHTDLFAFKLRPVELGRDSDGEPVTTCVVDSQGDLKTARRHALIQGKVQRALVRELEQHATGLARPALVETLVTEGFGKSSVQHAIADLLERDCLRNLHGLLVLA